MHYNHYIYIPGTQMTSVFEGQPPKTRPKLQSKQGAPFGFQVWLFQLDEPNLYIGNGWKSPFPSILNWLVNRDPKTMVYEIIPYITL